MGSFWDQPELSSKIQLILATDGYFHVTITALTSVIYLFICPDDLNVMSQSPALFTFKGVMIYLLM